MEKNILDKDTFVTLKERLNEIHKSTDYLHLNLVVKRKKLTNVEAKIEGIYDRFICVSSYVNKYKEDFTIQYIDILNNKIEINELNLN